MTENTKKVYRFPIVPCTYKFKSTGRRATIVDGHYSTEHSAEIAELDRKVKQGLLLEIPGVVTREQKAGQVSPSGFTKPIGLKTADSK